MRQELLDTEQGCQSLERENEHMEEMMETQRVELNGRIQSLESQQEELESRLVAKQVEHEQLHLNLAEKTVQLSIALESMETMRAHNRDSVKEKLIELTAKLSIEKVIPQHVF